MLMGVVWWCVVLLGVTWVSGVWVVAPLGGCGVGGGQVVGVCVVVLVWVELLLLRLMIQLKEATTLAAAQRHIDGRGCDDRGH